MNKLVKGSIAGAAGIALLLGGAGTLAVWNSSVDVTAASTGITAGTLEIAPASPVVTTDGWKHGVTTPVVISDISTFKIVPGDVLTFTKTFDVTATGNNLKATAALGALSITTPTSPSSADTALADALTKSAAFTIGGSAATSATIINPTAGKQTIVVTATITYPKNGYLVDGVTGAENSSKLGKVNLSTFAITLTQN